MNRSKEVVLFMVEDRIVGGNAWCDELCNTTLHQFLGKFRIFQLVADSDAFACTHQFREIGVKRMERETCHLHAFRSTVGTMRQYDAHNLRTDDGIFAVHLIEVTDTKQQYRIRMFRLDVEVLLHKRCI